MQEPAQAWVGQVRQAAAPSPRAAYSLRASFEALCLVASTTKEFYYLPMIGRYVNYGTIFYNQVEASPCIIPSTPLEHTRHTLRTTREQPKGGSR